MPLPTRPDAIDLLQRPALAAGVFVLSALGAIALSAVLTLAAPTTAHARARHVVEHGADGSTTGSFFGEGGSSGPSATGAAATIAAAASSESESESLESLSLPSSSLP